MHIASWCFISANRTSSICMVLEASCHGDSTIGKYRNAPPLERSKSAMRILVLSLDNHQRLFDLKLMDLRTGLGKSYLFRILGEWTQSTPREYIKGSSNAPCPVWKNEGSPHHYIFRMKWNHGNKRSHHYRILTDWTLVFIMPHSHLLRVLLETF
jgi:hypothetical protein